MDTNAHAKSIDRAHRIIVAISGASGGIWGIRLLQILAQRPEVETHLIITRSGALTLRLENPEWELDQVQALADVVHRPQDIAACIASGSYKVNSMVVVPCSMKSLAAIAHGYSDDLLARAADVMLKERRQLVLVPRETPLHSLHLQNMLTLSQLGAIILPPVPGFYHKPTSIEQLVDHTVGKILDVLGFEQDLFPIWQGPTSARSARGEKPQVEGPPAAGWPADAPESPAQPG